MISFRQTAAMSFYVLRHQLKVFKKGMVCRLPETAPAGIDISFLEKSYPAMHPPSFREQGEDFLSSLTFYQPSI